MIFLDKDRLFEKIDELENYLRELEEYLAENGVIPGSLSTRLNVELKDFYEFIETIDKYIELETGKPHE